VGAPPLRPTQKGSGRRPLRRRRMELASARDLEGRGNKKATEGPETSETDAPLIWTAWLPGAKSRSSRNQPKTSGQSKGCGFESHPRSFTLGRQSRERSVTRRWYCATASRFCRPGPRRTGPSLSADHADETCSALGVGHPVSSPSASRAPSPSRRLSDGRRSPIFRWHDGNGSRSPCVEGTRSPVDEAGRSAVERREGQDGDVPDPKEQ
jgi:hypothetical protein